MSDSNEYTLFCGKKLTLTKEEIEYLNDELTPTLEACQNRCPDEEVHGDISICPTLMNPKLNEYTLICGKKIRLTREEWEYVIDPWTVALDLCVQKCPDKEIGGDVNHCEFYLKADEAEYADDPAYQEHVKSLSKEKKPKKK